MVAGHRKRGCGPALGFQAPGVRQQYRVTAACYANRRLWNDERNLSSNLLTHPTSTSPRGGDVPESCPNTLMEVLLRFYNTIG